MEYWHEPDEYPFPIRDLADCARERLDQWSERFATPTADPLAILRSDWANVATRGVRQLCDYLLTAKPVALGFDGVRAYVRLNAGELDYALPPPISLDRAVKCLDRFGMPSTNAELIEFDSLFNGMGTTYGWFIDVEGHLTFGEYAEDLHFPPESPKPTDVEINESRVIFVGGDGCLLLLSAAGRFAWWLHNESPGKQIARLSQRSFGTFLEEFIRLEASGEPFDGYLHARVYP